MLIIPERILVLAPHTDDAELGAGGSMTKWLEAGVDLHVAVFSTAEESLPNGSAPTPDGQPGEPGYTQPEADPVPLESPASVADAQVKLAVEAVNVEATVPGEISGPAVRVKVTTTAGSSALDLSGASVTVTYGQESTPAVMLTSDQQSQTLPDSVAAGSEATGVYDFAIPEGSRDQVVVRVYLNSQEPVAVFSGAVS